MDIVLGFIGSNGMWLPLEIPDPITDGWVVMIDGERPNDNCYANSAGKWVMGLSPDQKEEAIKSAEQTKTILISVASNKISTLKDRIEAGQDRDAELKLWKAYRIALDDIDTSLAPDIEWPVVPE